MARTPKVRPITEDMIPTLRARRRKTAFGGCYMCSGIFVKADRTLGCSCQIGYYANLGDIAATDVGAFVNGPVIRYIRESFKAGYEPFDMCGSCVSRAMEYPPEWHETDIAVHVEPSNQCNLFCEICLCTDERKSSNTPPRVNLDYDAFEKMVRDIAAAGLRIRRLALVGFGEPLFSSEVPRMTAVARATFPEAFIFMDTNANFGEKRAEEIANCGFDEIRLSIDGVDQRSYEAYRKRGNFEKTIAFARRLAAAVRETDSTTKLIWKYILFRHNDRDDQIRAAVQMADELKIEIQFDVTVGSEASSRSLDEINAILDGHRIGSNLDLDAQRKMAS